uniref:Uncharacterized protein n=1 Tax=Arundo donax TaxID=35708 RepID=A0A0A8ZK30_ARUDO
MPSPRLQPTPLVAFQAWHHS